MIFILLVWYTVALSMYLKCMSFKFSIQMKKHVNGIFIKSMWYENNECTRKSLNIWTPLCTFVVKVVLIINHIKKWNLVLCNHIIYNVLAFDILCYWHIRKYFHQKFNKFMKANDEWSKLCNNLSIKGIHNIHSSNLKH